MQTTKENGTPMNDVLGTINQREVEAILKAAFRYYNNPNDADASRKLLKTADSIMRAAEIRFIEANYMAIQ
jgi:hypothetical protein